MKAIIVNNHCDARVFRVPGTRKFIKLPAFGSLPVRFSSEEEMQAAEAELRRKVPAARIVVQLPTFLPSDSSAAYEIPSEAVATEVVVDNTPPPLNEVPPPDPVVDATPTTKEDQPVAEPEPPQPEQSPVLPPKAKKPKNTPDKRKRRSSK